ncbi:MAG: ATP-binding protein [Phycisphaera sp.]|nr:MAG: ATP-binding protein [Phycisphaera sp.]
MPPLPFTDSDGHKSLFERVQFAISRLQEESDIEFKRSEPWESLRYSVTRSALAMANLSGGGIVLIGVNQQDDAWMLDGMSESHLATYQPDIVLDQINAFASPNVKLILARHEIEASKEILVLEIQPFFDIPVVCKKNGPDGKGLVSGTIYIRPLGGKPESRPIRTAEEAHMLLERAAEVRSTDFLQKTRRLGLQSKADDLEKFTQELGDL